MNQQRGMTFISVVFMIASIVFVAVIGMKLWPAYSEYFSVKKAFASLKSQMGGGTMSKQDIIAAFERHATIDDIRSINGKDLVIEQSDRGQVVSVEYSVVEPLVGNVSALVEFKLSTDTEQAAAE